MSKHTPEPWMLHYDENSGEWPMIMAGCIVSGKIVANVNPSSFCIPAQGFVEMPSLDNARRIVACVNACRGIPTDELEQKGLVAAVGIELLMLDGELAEIKQQRDELLAELKSWQSGKVHPRMKAGCAGEFEVSIETVCHHCHYNGPDDDCEACNGDGEYTIRAVIPWDTQKDIFRAMCKFKAEGGAA